MTTSEYAEYEAAFADFMRREGLCNLSTVSSHVCDDDCRSNGCSGSDENDCEPYFSHRRCECCNRPYGGDRYDCSGYVPENNAVSDVFSVCGDCMYYAEYGALDDTTMAEIEADKGG